MRMALCLFGQPRTAAFCADSLYTELISVYHPDIFLSTDSQEALMRSLYHPISMEIASEEEETQIIGERMSRYGKSVPNPGPYKEYPIYPSRDLSFLYKNWRCREMLRNHEAKFGDYDVIVGTRFDAKFLKIQPITLPNKNTLYIPRIDAFGKEAVNGIHWGMGYCAHIWWADSITGCFLLNCFNWSDDYYKETKKWGGEGMMKYICDKNKIDVQYTDVTFMLIRGTNERPMEGLPPWSPLSKTCHPEYLPKDWGKRVVQDKKTPSVLNPLDN